MATNRPSPVGPLLQAMFAQEGGGQSDGQLLEQFLLQRNQAAFATLMRRHGGMVLGVCRRLLGNAADADDAFQATFLVLIRKASTLTSRVVIGDWLHGVARRTALKSRAAAARRREIEQAAARSEAAPTEGRNDWLPLLDQEIRRLPEKHRLPIVLCDLEGKTIREAAERLGWPEGTVAGRLARGRARLAQRLLQSAQILSVGAFATMTAGTARAALPLELFQRTLHAAALFAAGESTATGVLSAESLAIAKGVILSMFWNKVKLAALVMAVGIVLASAGGKTVQMLAAPAPVPQAKSTPNNASQNKAGTDYPVRPSGKRAPTELEIELAKVAQMQWDARMKEYRRGIISEDKLLPWSALLLKAQLTITSSKAETVAAHQRHVSQLKEFEKIAKEKYDSGAIPFTAYNPFIYYRIEAEIWLEEAQRAK